MQPAVWPRCRPPPTQRQPPAVAAVVPAPAPALAAAAPAASVPGAGHGHRSGNVASPSAVRNIGIRTYMPSTHWQHERMALVTGAKQPAPTIAIQTQSPSQVPPHQHVLRRRQRQRRLPAVVRRQQAPQLPVVWFQHSCHLEQSGSRARRNTVRAPARMHADFEQRKQAVQLYNSAAIKWRWLYGGARTCVRVSGSTESCSSRAVEATCSSPVHARVSLHHGMGADALGTSGSHRHLLPSTNTSVVPH